MRWRRKRHRQRASEAGVEETSGAYDAEEVSADGEERESPGGALKPEEGSEYSQE
jgi:hypothetical protein